MFFFAFDCLRRFPPGFSRRKAVSEFAGIIIFSPSKIQNCQGVSFPKKSSVKKRFFFFRSMTYLYYKNFTLRLNPHQTCFNLNLAKVFSFSYNANVQNLTKSLIQSPSIFYSGTANRTAQFKVKYS